MVARRTYRRTPVKKIAQESLTQSAILKGGPGTGGTSVGLDIAKKEIVAVVRWPDGSFECPWSIVNPLQIDELMLRLEVLRETCDRVTIGLESTGTYGEAVRYAMTKADFNVHRVSGKASSDYKEIFDGVPSQHDGKDAAIIGELTSFGKGKPWPYEPPSETEQEMRHQVQRLSAFRGHATEWTGRLEGVLAKHWPELTNILSLTSVTLAKMLIHYGSPAAVAADSSAEVNLRKWGRSFLSTATINEIIESPRTTRGLPLGKGEMAWLQEIAEQLRKSILEVKACEKRLEEIAESQDSMRGLVEVVGASTLCVIWSTVGDPRNYDSSGAFLKASGLNLKELSSGKRQGQLAITKRGPNLVRKYLYFWALRAAQRPELKRWYGDYQRVGRGVGEHRKMKGIVALMRKLYRSLWWARKHDEAFSYAKVFPGRPLEERRRRRQRRA